jgi:hypothetical protein
MPKNQRLVYLNEKIYNFEIKKLHAFLLLCGIILISILIQLHPLNTVESGHDYQNVLPQVQAWNYQHIFDHFDLHVLYGLLSLSNNYLHNIRLVPFISSLAILVINYFFTVKVSHKRISGIIATAILASSRLFIAYDASATYTTFWFLFYLLSIYVLYTKFWYTSILFFILGFFSKTMVVLFIPMSMYVILKSNLKPLHKKILLLTYAGIVAGVAVIYFSGINITYTDFHFTFEKLIDGTTDWWVYLFHTDRWIVMIIPLTIFSMYIVGRKGHPHGHTIFVLMMGMILTSVLMAGVTDMTNQPYRFIPLISYFSMAVGIMFGKKLKKI